MVSSDTVPISFTFPRTRIKLITSELARLLEKTIVSFRKIDNDEIDFYVNNYDVLDKAGGYGIQCYASKFVKGIEGCFYNVMGLPLSRLSVELNKLKAID